MSTFAERLRYALSSRGMRPSVLSYKTGLSEATISHYLAGHYEPKTKRVDELAKALHVSTAWLSGYDVPMEDGSSTLHGIKIPVLGKVAAGIPITAISDILDYEEISPDMVKDGSEFFALSIKGDSMEPKISEGDVVIVRKQSYCESGQIAIVQINGDEATCKRFVKKNDGVVLQSFNPAYEPMYYSSEEVRELPVCIIGRVVELRAKF